METLGPAIAGKTIRLNMDSMCSVRNIMKGGGPVPLLCYLVKELWQLCRSLSIQLLPRWQRRNVTMMQRADDLSKVGTEWRVRESFRHATEAEHQLPMLMPDLARAEPAITAVIRREESLTLILPRWEGKSWWQLVLSHAVVVDLPASEMPQVVEPNIHGFPRWDFVVAVFRPPYSM